MPRRAGPAAQASSEPALPARLILLCHAATPAMRAGAFPHADETLDDGGAAKAAALRLPGPAPGTIVASPARAARETAAAMGLAARPEPALGDVGHGDWTGLSLAEVHARAPEALAAWIADPSSGAPGGEPPAALERRVGDWLAGVDQADGRVLAISHPATIRAALACALDLPPRATARFDIGPLTRVTLSFHGQWRLQGLER